MQEDVLSVSLKANGFQVSICNEMVCNPSTECCDQVTFCPVEQDYVIEWIISGFTKFRQGVQVGYLRIKIE